MRQGGFGGVQSSRWIEPGTLWARVGAQTRTALRAGALEPIRTHSERVREDGVDFVVRVISSLARKPRGQGTRAGTLQGGRERDPFLPPYEEALWVGDLSETHVCLLNKYNVVEHHLLVVTRDFEHQEAALTQADFEAAWRCLRELDGLVFYNAGRVAGASQPHKHLQLVALPLAPHGPALPVAPVLAEARPRGPILVAPGFRFRHALAPARESHAAPLAEAAARTLAAYRAMLKALALASGPRLSPYNLLMTREWMWLVPRSREGPDSISVNALGFAGALLARDERELAFIRREGPMRVLEQVGYPRG